MATMWNCMADGNRKVTVSPMLPKHLNPSGTLHLVQVCMSPFNTTCAVLLPLLPAVAAW
jgi:hypothetical protein